LVSYTLIIAISHESREGKGKLSLLPSSIAEAGHIELPKVPIAEPAEAKEKAAKKLELKKQ
jgi:hypothetical protein